MKLGRIFKDQRGAAAVEFAMLATPMIALVMVSIQTAIVFFMDQTLQTAAKQATRELMTGAAQNSSVTQSQFKSTVCADVPGLNCSNLYVDVQSGSDFSSINTSAYALTFNSGGSVTNTFNYSPGGPGDIVIVRVMYLWPIFGGPLAVGLGGEPGNTQLLSATVVFKNEPYASS